MTSWSCRAVMVEARWCYALLGVWLLCMAAALVKVSL